MLAPTLTRGALHMPCDYSKYPANWKEIRASILKRAENRCERCDAMNHALGYRNWAGVFISTGDHWPVGERLLSVQAKVFKIVLTIAHLDHDVKNNEPENLQALCQQCHNRHDFQHRAETRKAKKGLATDPQ